MDNRPRDYNRIANAVSAAVIERLWQKKTIGPVPEGVRIDGKVCLVTGANSGLGKAVAIDLAKRGGHVLMACRSGHPEAGEEVRLASGSDRVEMLRVDLAELESVHTLCDLLKRRRRRLDITVLNAGLMPGCAPQVSPGIRIDVRRALPGQPRVDRQTVARWLDSAFRAPRRTAPNRDRGLRSASIRRPYRLRRLRRLYRLWPEGWTQVLRGKQAAPLHLRARTVAPPESRRRGFGLP